MRFGAPCTAPKQRFVLYVIDAQGRVRDRATGRAQPNPVLLPRTSQAMYLAGGEHWSAYYPAVRDEILGVQERDGHWEDEVGKTYATAMACVVLQMPCEYLPIFQK